MDKFTRVIRTDMADESRVVGAGTQTKTRDSSLGAGIRIENDGDNDVAITRVHVDTQEGEQKVGKPIGS